MGRLLGVLRLFRHDILVMLLSLKSRQTPRKVKGMMLLAILYLLSPIDFSIRCHPWVFRHGRRCRLPAPIAALQYVVAAVRCAVGL